MAENSKKYLDLEGLQTLWNKIDATFIDSNELSAGVANGIESISMVYDEDNAKIILKRGEEEISSMEASQFVKDGMLSDVEVVTATEEAPINGETSGKFIKFTWNTDAASEEDVKVDYIAISDLGVKTAAETTFSTSFAVTGAALSDELIAAGITQIDQNTSVEEVLMALLCKELYPENLKKTGASISASLSMSNISASKTSGVAEVDSTITTDAYTAPVATKTVGGISFSGFTNGYSTTTGADAVVTAGNPSSITPTESTDNTKKITLTPTITGFTGGSTTAVEGTQGSAPTYAAQTLKVVVGTNKFALATSAEADIFSATWAGHDKFYAASNLGKVDAEKAPSIAAATEVTKKSAAPTSVSKEFSVTGVYPVFHNAKSGGNLASCDNKIVENISSKEITFGPESDTTTDTIILPVGLWEKAQLYAPAFKSWNDLDAALWTVTETDIVYGGVKYEKYTRKNANKYTEDHQLNIVFKKSTSSK